MIISFDEDVKQVAEFLQANVPHSKLVSTVAALNDLAPILWGKQGPENIRALSLDHEPICRDLHTPRDAT